MITKGAGGNRAPVARRFQMANGGAYGYRGVSEVASRPSEDRLMNDQDGMVGSNPTLPLFKLLGLGCRLSS